MSFAHELTIEDLPDEVLDQARACLLDLVGVAAAGSRTRLSTIARAHAAQHLRGQGHGARLLFDGRAVSPVGAAFANAATIDAVDAHDGHRLTKGHAGVAVLPAGLAVLPNTASMGDLLATLVVGYEIANRAGIALHAAGPEYHSSGAWNALGAGAAAARLLRLDADTTAHALGIAEYHAPRGPMMRCIDHPTMVKDSSAWGAQAGVSAALLAADGFTGAPADLVVRPAGADDVWLDLGERWTILDQYFKPYPVCRWAHPAVHAVLGLVADHDVAPHDIAGIEVATFRAAARLGTAAPANTEQAQYSLPFPVAAAAVYQRLDPDTIARPTQVDRQVLRLSGATKLQESAAMTAAFPERRRADVTLVLTDGTRLTSGPTEAPGDPEDRLSARQIEAKFLQSVRDAVGETRARRLLTMLRKDQEQPLVEMLRELYAPAN